MNIMIDIETLDGKETACIVSIGAVAFDTQTPFKIYKEFYRTIDLPSNEKLNRTFEADTITWWMAQSKEAQFVFSDIKNQVSFIQGLNELRNFINEYTKPTIWANGTLFDLVILRHAFEKTLKQKTPWHFKNEMCMRPIRLIGDRIGDTWSDFLQNQQDKNNLALAVSDMYEKVEICIKHNALSDAKMQAEYVNNIFMEIEAKK